MQGFINPSESYWPSLKWMDGWIDDSLLIFNLIKKNQFWIKHPSYLSFFGGGCKYTPNKYQNLYYSALILERGKDKSSPTPWVQVKLPSNNHNLFLSLTLTLILTWGKEKYQKEALHLKCCEGKKQLNKSNSFIA